MRLLNTLLIIFCFLSATIISCSTDSDSSTELNIDGSFNQLSKDQKVIYEIKTHIDKLLVGTDSGLHQLEPGSISWKSLGIDSAAVRAFLIFNNQELMAASNFDNGDSLTIAKTADGGETWVSARNSYGGEKSHTIPTSLVQLDKNTSVLYAGGSLLTIAQSTNQGSNWKVLLGSWEGFGSIRFIRVNPKKPEVLWSGGTTATFAPYLVKSTDGGGTWERLGILENVETTVYDVATHPSDNNTVIAGLGIGIRKSTDGGRSWTTTFDQAGIFTLARSARDGRIVYAAGTTRDGRLSFFASSDFGDTWQQVTLPDSPAGMQVNDMVSVTENGREVLYLGTNKGVYSYQFDE